jgi:uncharacterized protein (TIGR04222 family)
MIEVKIKSILMVIAALIVTCIYAPIFSAETAEEWNEKGVGFVVSGEYEKSIECFDKAIELNPNDDSAHNNRGVAYNNLKQYERAIEDFNRAIELNPDLANAYNKRGVAYYNLKQYEKAISDFSRAIELNPDDAGAHNKRGAAHYNLNQYETAIEDFDKAIELNPDLTGAYSNRELAYGKLNQHENTIEDQNRTIEPDTDDDEVYTNRVVVLSTLEEIPGPTFLMLFAGLVIATIAICRLWINADGSKEYLLPDLTHFDSIALAALRGREKLAIQIAVFRLWDRKLIDISGEGKNAEIQVRKQSRQNPSGAVEGEIYQFLQSPEKLKDMFSNTGLRNRIKMHLEPVQRELERLHIARTKSDRMRAWRITALAYLTIFGVGGLKIYLGILHDRPTGNLFVLLWGSLIVLVIATYVIFDPSANPTSLGQRYLRKLEKHFGWLKESVERGSAPEGIDPSLAVAIFGVGVLAGSSLYQPYSEAVSQLEERSTGWIGGCGGGGGGCGGGGGGCGGCGGD